MTGHAASKQPELKAAAPFVPRRPSRRLVAVGAVVTAAGAAGVGATIPALLSGANGLVMAEAAGFAAVALVGAGLVSRARRPRAIETADDAPVEDVPAPAPAAAPPPPASTALGHRIRYPAEFVMAELLPPPNSAGRHPFPFAPPLPPPVEASPAPLPPPRLVETVGVAVPPGFGPAKVPPIGADQPGAAVAEPPVVEPPFVEEPVGQPAEPLLAAGHLAEPAPTEQRPVVGSEPALEPVIPEPVVEAEPAGEPFAVEPEPERARQAAPPLSPLLPEPVRAVPPFVPGEDRPADDALVVPRAGAEASLAEALGESGNRLLDEYRHWVLEQAVGDQPFHALDIDGDRRELFLLSSCGVATLLAWLHEQHRATYNVDTWINEILPSEGIAIEDRELAVDLLIAAALYAGGIHSAPTDRLREYRPEELITAMATMHVGLLRLYCGLGRRHPAIILGRQFDNTRFANRGG